jgi:phosphatidylethanolamine-binding protein (PEBP) family uncharacterized protein
MAWLARVGALMLAMAPGFPLAERAAAADVFTLTSPSFVDGAMLDPRIAGNDKTNPNCVGANTSPPFAWANPPAGTTSFALLMFDPEGRNGLGVSHQVAYGIAATARGFVAGKGTRGFSLYYGPCPPPGTGIHHFVFTVIATDLAPDALPPGLTREELFDRLKGHAKAVAGIVGRYAQ